MAKIDIDQIVKGKLDKIQFDFKDEYWADMEKSLLADCTEEVVTATAFSAFTSTLLIVSFTAIITILAVFPWAYDFDNTTKEQATTPKAVPAVIEQKEEVKADQNLTKEQAEPKPEVKKEEPKPEVKVVVKKKAKARRNKRKSVSKKRTATSETKKQEQKSIKADMQSPKTESGIREAEKPARKEATSIEPYDSTRIKQENVISDKGVQHIEQNQDTNENKLISNNISVDNDSIYIPDAVLSGDKAEGEMKDVQVDVEERPLPPKTVKPRNKPVKHVFKKRRGILYRMGLRK